MKLKCLVALVVSLGLLSTLAVAQSGEGYDLTWNTVDGGGYAFASEYRYTLGGTAGQSDAGVLAEGEYTLRGGFWSGCPIGYDVYLYLPSVLVDL